MARFFKILRVFALSVIGLVILTAILINLTPVQNFAVRKAAESLSAKLKTKVSIGHVRLDFLNHLLIQGLYIEDQQGDTLLYAGEARVRITDWFVFRKDKPVVHYLGLKQAYGHLYRTRASEKWNYKFVLDAFDTGARDTTKKQNEFELDLKKLDLRDIRVHMDDAWVGSDFDIDLGNVQVDARKVDLKGKQLDLNSVLVERSIIHLKDYEGGRPAAAKKKKVTDTTAFNPGKWVVKLGSIRLNDNTFRLDAAERPAYDQEFDHQHMAVTGIDLDAERISIAGDTIRGRIAHLEAKERSGIMIRKMSADVTVSPNASICENLYLETNNSVVRDYYAMLYERFPAFNDYIHSVKMVGKLKDSRVDSRDIAYFAPVLRKYPTLARISGNVSGTVDRLTGTGLKITDGTTSISGDAAMTGLPDIYSTFISFRNGEISTTEKAILKYAPELRNNPNIDVTRLGNVRYKGNFNGYIDNFIAAGSLSTGIGSVVADIKLRIPDFNSRRAMYSGTVSSPQFNLGALLRQPLLGGIAFRAGISGVAFDPEQAAVKLNTVISHFDVKGYRYRNITAEGTLERKKFDGNLLVDDPNLALAFYGNIDFSKDVLDINAKANLLKSDLQALNLVKDSVLATADFDLNFVGNNIDEFLGYAKLYNINVVRNHRRLDVDSVYVNSSKEDGLKLLTIESNDLTARIKGNFQLSSLPYSVQFYVSGYLPNYIQAPTKYAPNQELSFNIVTRQIDSLLGVVIPDLKGFDSARLSGSLNTAQQQLSLNADIPYGYFSNISLRNVAIKSTGNFRQLTLNADIENITVGNDILTASMAIDTKLGNDSLNFNITTNSPDAIGRAKINGAAFASGDTLYLGLAPSEFYLNDNRWEIPDGNSFVLSNKYLYLRGLKLRSGGQQIDAASHDEGTTQSLDINVHDLDVTALGNLAGLAGYKPAGRINGDVSLSHIFDGLLLTGDLSATEMRLGTDTLGTVNLSGSYNAPKKIITLEPQSGIYMDGSSIRTAGSMSFDSTSRQKLSGYVQFTEAPLKWASPLVTGFLSSLSGTLNGQVNISGSAEQPDIDGTVSVHNAATRIDITGVYYRIPKARLKVDSKLIEFGRVNIYDVNNNTAVLTGGIAHDRFKNWRFSEVTVTSPELEVLNLKEYENNTFYGNLTANVRSLTLRGTFEDIRLSIKATPAARSHIYIPVKTSSDINTYSYVSFKNSGKEQIVERKKRNKFSLIIDGEMNPLAEMTLVLDPATGDMINARGSGNMILNVPSNDDIKINGSYEIDEGNYTFTFRQLFFRRNFIINSGSKISFNGPLSATKLDINGLYTTKARLIDLLQESEKQIIPDAELKDAKAPQDVNVLLHMSGSLQEPKLTFNIDLPEKRSEGNFAYLKLRRINQNDRELFDQVAALLLIHTFIPPEGIGGSAALTGGVNNISEILSSTASTQLTNIVNKLLGDPDLSVELKYKNYNLSDPTVIGDINRNEISIGFKKNFFNDRLIVELGSAYDWGRPSSSNSSASNLNLADNFRVQYLLTEDGRFRLNAFRTNNYDVLVDRNIWRGGVGLSYRKTFNNLHEFLHKPKPIMEPVEEKKDTSQTEGTW